MTIIIGYVKYVSIHTSELLNTFVTYCCVDISSDDLVTDVKLCRTSVVNTVVISMEDARELCRSPSGVWTFTIEYIVNPTSYITAMPKYTGIKYNNFPNKDGIGKEILCALQTKIKNKDTNIL